MPRRVVRPLQAFLDTEVAGGPVLLAASVLALVWANLATGGPRVDAEITFLEPGAEAYAFTFW